MRYFLAAALAVVMALPPANVGAGTLGEDAFLLIGASADLSDIESIYCGNLQDPNIWVFITVAEDGTTFESAYIGSDAKVSAKGGVRMKQSAASANGDIRFFTDFPTARPRGPAPGPTETDVKASMTASFNPKTLSAAAKVVDKTNGTTAELTGATEVYLVSNLALLVCQDLIDQVEGEGTVPPSVRALAR